MTRAPSCMRVLLVAALLPLTLVLIACAVVYVKDAPRLQHVGGSQPFCLFACDAANTATAAEGSASSVEGGAITQSEQRSITPRAKKP